MKTYYDAEGNKIEGVSRGEYWNGFNVIYVTRKELIKWLDNMDIRYSTNDKGDVIADGDIDDIFSPSDIDNLYSLMGYCITD